jgi:hypothetical protein
MKHNFLAIIMRPLVIFTVVQWALRYGEIIAEKAKIQDLAIFGYLSILNLAIALLWALKRANK